MPRTAFVVTNLEFIVSWPGKLASPLAEGLQLALYNGHQAVTSQILSIMRRRFPTDNARFFRVHHMQSRLLRPYNQGKGE